MVRKGCYKTAMAYHQVKSCLPPQVLSSWKCFPNLELNSTEDIVPADSVVLQLFHQRIVLL